MILLVLITILILFAYEIHNIRKQIKKRENFESGLSNEALQNIASLYNTKDTLTIPNLKVTGNVEIDNNCTVSGESILKNCSVSGETALKNCTVSGSTTLKDELHIDLRNTDKQAGLSILGSLKQKNAPYINFMRYKTGKNENPEFANMQPGWITPFDGTTVFGGDIKVGFEGKKQNLIMDSGNILAKNSSLEIQNIRLKNQQLTNPAIPDWIFQQECGGHLVFRNRINPNSYNASCSKGLLPPLINSGDSRVAFDPSNSRDSYL